MIENTITYFFVGLIFRGIICIIIENVLKIKFNKNAKTGVFNPKIGLILFLCGCFWFDTNTDNFYYDAVFSFGFFLFEFIALANLKQRKGKRA